MLNRKSFLAQYWLVMRLTVALLIILIVPAILLWSIDGLLHPNQAQILSILIIIVSFVMTYLMSRRLASFPGRQIRLVILPLLVGWLVLSWIVVALFHLSYSVYYIVFSGILSAIYFYWEAWLRSHSKVVIGYIPLGRMSEKPQAKHITWLELTEPRLPEQPIDAVVADLYMLDGHDDWQKFLAHCALQNVPVFNIRQVEESINGRIQIRHVYENELGSLLISNNYLVLKRIIDIVCSLSILLLLSPIMLITAIVIRLESAGGALFVQKRVGQFGREFTIYKFRSMCHNSEEKGAKFASAGDMRITRIGKFIRKTRLDELPQLFNVLRGDMSLIGPRPEQKVFVDQFEQSIPFYTYRHIVKPGISGWAQVMQGYVANEDDTKVKIEYDFYYIKHCSFSLDMLIFFKTISTVLTGFGAR